MVILAIAIFLTAMALIILQNVLGSGAPKLLQSYHSGYADGYRDARAQFAPAAAALDGLPLKSITARVTHISGNTLEVEVIGLGMDERVDGVGSKRTVTVAGDAVVTIQTRLDDGEYVRQLRAWDPQGDDEPPAPFTTAEGSLTDIQVGDLVQLTSSAEDVDLRTAGSFQVNAVTKVAVPEPLNLPDIETPPLTDIPPPPAPTEPAQ